MRQLENKVFGLNPVNNDITTTIDEHGNVYIVKMPKNKCQAYVLGIDEAGRGPLAGPLVYSAMFWEETRAVTKYKDSKTVGVTKRGLQFQELCDDPSVGFVICALSPIFISLNMLNHMEDLRLAKLARISRSQVRKVPKSKKRAKLTLDEPAPNTLAKYATICPQPATLQPELTTTSKTFIGTPEPDHSSKPDQHRLNLNELSLECVSQIIQVHIIDNVCISKIFMDTIGPPETVTTMLKTAMKTNTDLKTIVVESKADAKYQIVSAASIGAKVVRDAFIMNLDTQEAIYGTRDADIGSGYPSDPITQRWLTSVLKPGAPVPSIVRTSWKPVIERLGAHPLPPSPGKVSLKAYLPKFR
ncbi:ribonuclease H2 subunit A [Nematocida displodere]|uniref:Ribonuclease n=1 Tax=Nematocida displodere TaxID=1805483 RepID=A0A177EG35_9MICR|nr:ribonuclease H2 subunit A [Nematocida displodere]